MRGLDCEKNRLFISREFGTYQFIGDILSNLPPEAFDTPEVSSPSFCIRCDECRKVCPYTKEAIHTGTAISPIPFFHENRITRLTTAQVSAMDEDTFRRRAFAWRGREVVLRNTAVLEEAEEK